MKRVHSVGFAMRDKIIVLFSLRKYGLWRNFRLIAPLQGAYTLTCISQGCTLGYLILPPWGIKTKDRIA
jgi:hypothetical protein